MCLSFCGQTRSGQDGRREKVGVREHLTAILLALGEDPGVLRVVNSDGSRAPVYVVKSEACGRSLSSVRSPSEIDLSVQWSSPVEAPAGPAAGPCVGPDPRRTRPFS